MFDKNIGIRNQKESDWYLAPPIEMWNISYFAYHHDCSKPTVIQTLPTPGLPHTVQPMISTRVYRRTLVAGVLGFLVFCSFLYGTSVSKTYYNKAIENRLRYSTTAITTPTFVTGANTAGAETVASFYVTTSVLTQTEQDEAHDDDEETAIDNVEDHVSASPANKTLLLLDQLRTIPTFIMIVIFHTQNSAPNPCYPLVQRPPRLL